MRKGRIFPKAIFAFGKDPSAEVSDADRSASTKRQGKGADNDEVEPPPGLENERVWPPPALVDAWVRKGKGLGKERGIEVRIGKGPGRDKGKGNARNNEVLLGHVWDLVDAVVGKGNGKGKEEDMEQRKGKGYVWP